MTYFTLEEFDSPDVPGSGSNMDDGFLDMIDDAREIAGVPFVINSGYRSREHNKKVGGVSNSSHTLGNAADIACTDGVSRLKILEALFNVGFRRMGIAKTFIHVDNDETKPDNIWLYS